MIDIETRPPSAGGRPDWLAASLERGGGQLLYAAVDEADLADALRAQDKLRVVRSDRSRQGRPYAAWKPALETLAEALPSLTEIQQSALAELASIDADAGRLAELPSYQARYRLFDACRALLEEAGRRQPFVVLLPALDSMDRPSLRLLLFLWPFLPDLRVTVLSRLPQGASGREDQRAVLKRLVAGPMTGAIPYEAGRSAADWLAEATWAKRVGAPEHAASCLSQALAASPAGRREAILEDLILVAAEAGVDDQLAERIADWRALGPAKTPVQIAGFARAVMEAGAARDAVGQLIDGSAGPAELPADRLVWARLRMLDPPRLEEIADGRVKVGRWIGADAEAVRILRTLGDEGDYARTLVVYDWWPKEEIEALIPRIRAWRNESARSRGLSVAAETLMYRHGAFAEACRLLEEQVALHQGRGAIEELAKAQVRLTMAQLADGQLDGAERTRSRARETVNRLGPDYLIYEHAGTKSGGDLYPEISMESNFAWYRDGDWLAVAEHWARAVAMHESGGSPVHIVEAAMAAQAYARLGRFDDACVYLDELASILPHLEPRDWAFNGAVGRASHAIWDMLNASYAPQFRAHASDLLAAGVGDWTNTSLLQTVARMAALTGDFDAASDHFARARESFSPSQRPQRAIVDFDEAIALRLMDRDPERRRSLLDAAVTTFRAYRMDGWEARLAAETRRSGAGR